MAELKPCPFCGEAPNKPKLHGYTIFPFEERWSVSHFCQNISVTAYGNSPETAIEAWDRRAGE